MLGDSPFVMFREETYARKSTNRIYFD
jgi:hypothetical protein